jgi:hypothetical protein
MTPSVAQKTAMVLAESEGYLRPASPTHAKRCRTSVAALARTARSCVANGWMRPISGGRYQLTDAGREHVPSVRKPDWYEF